MISSSILITMEYTFFLYVGICLSHLGLLNSANILVILPTPSRSHFKSFQPLFVELAKRGHNITVMGVFPLEKSIPNYHDFNLTNIDNDLGFVYSDIRAQTRIENMKFIYEKLSSYTEKFLSQKVIQDFLRTGQNQFDLIFLEIYYLDSFMGFGYQFKSPVIALSTQQMLSIYHWIMKIPAPFSCTPNLYLPFTDEMSFMERFINFNVEMYNLFLYELWYAPKFQTQFEKYFDHGSYIPRVKDLIGNVSAVFVNSHFSAGYVKPIYPNIIDLAGIHINSDDFLLPDIEKFLNNSEQGFVYVSMGSMLKPEDLTKYEHVLLQVLKQLEHNVLWKWKINSTSEIPSNILVRQWLPQTKILNHANCKLFITHGGYHSIIEAINAAIPMVGIPFHSDQQYNLALVEKLGIGLSVHEFDERSLTNAIRIVSRNTEYNCRVKFQSKIFKDRQSSPLDNAVYWTEYVIRYKGAPHMRNSASKLYWFQYYTLDIIFVIIFSCIAIMIGFYHTVNSINNIVRQYRQCDIISLDIVILPKKINFKNKCQ